jgi:hypothetical protein
MGRHRTVERTADAVAVETRGGWLPVGKGSEVAPRGGSLSGRTREATVVTRGIPECQTVIPTVVLPSRGSRPHKDKRAITQTTTLLPLFMQARGRAGDWMPCKADKTIARRLHRTPARGVSLETPIVTPGTDLSRTVCSFKSLLPLPPVFLGLCQWVSMASSAGECNGGHTCNDSRRR